MSPGQKKRGMARRTADDRRSTEPDKFSRGTSVNQQAEAKVSGNTETVTEDFTAEDRKYQKRKIVSNVDRYAEPIRDPHMDEKRGNDYEVLLSYSGGAGSQHRFIEEKEWEESSDEKINLTLDFNNLIERLKCIPFHERLHLPKDIFELSQIDKMVQASERSRHSVLNVKDRYDKIKLEQTPPDSLLLNQEENLMFQINEDDENQDDDFVDSHPPAITAGTESLIESLASCLTLEKRPHVDTKLEVKSTEPTFKDDSSNELDFLLSLSVPGLSASHKNDDTNTKARVTNASVAEWLDSVIDD